MKNHPVALPQGYKVELKIQNCKNVRYNIWGLPDFTWTESLKFQDTLKRGSKKGFIYRHNAHFLRTQNLKKVI